MKKLLEYKHKDNEIKILESHNLSADMIFKKYDISEGDIIKVNSSEISLIVENGKVLDIKEEGEYILSYTEGIDEEFEKQWGDLQVRKAENDGLCIIFINKEVIKHNKYYINDPIKYKDFKNNRQKEIKIKIEGSYDFKIENPKAFLSKVIGLRKHFSKQELIEKVRKYILNSIEKGINELSEEYKLDVEDLPENSKHLEIKLKQNEYDKKLLEYGVKLTYFDIDKLEVINKKFKFF